LDGETANADKRAVWLRTNQGVGVVITVMIGLLLLYLSQQDWVFEKLRDGFQLGFFTIVSAFTMLACSLAMIFDGHKRQSDKEMAAMDRKDFTVPAIAAAVCFISFMLAWGFDFLLVTPVFLAVGVYVLGIRPIRKCGISGVIITVIIFAMFRVIGISLPSFIIPA
jgi:predicted Co/Zn/Cd cation transporter (cation efflux family)